MGHTALGCFGNVFNRILFLVDNETPMPKIKKLSIIRIVAESLGHLVACLFILHVSAFITHGTNLLMKVGSGGFLNDVLWIPINQVSALTLALIIVEAYLVGRYFALPIFLTSCLPPCSLVIISGIELEMVPGSHNLWGIEAAIYILFLGPPFLIAGSFGRCVKGKVNKSPAEGCCFRCGYNLTGNTSGSCPECNTAVPWRLRWR